MPASLSDWIDHLQQHPLPAMPRTIQRIGQLLSSPVATHADYARVIVLDPGFTLAVFRHLHDIHRLTDPVVSLVHGVSLLGTGPVTAFSSELPRLNKPLPGKIRSGLHGCYAQAIHAAAYARQWGDMRRDPHSEEAAIAALLHNCGEMALWGQAREQMQKIEQHRQRGLDRDSAALAVLGFTLDQLSLGLAQAWGLPPLAEASLQPFGAFQPRPLGVMLANAVARASAQDWYSEQTRELTELLAEYLALEMDQATALLHRQAVDVAHQLQGLPLSPAAADLLSPPPMAASPKAAAPVAGRTESKPADDAEKGDLKPDDGGRDAAATKARPTPAAEPAPAEKTQPADAARVQAVTGKRPDQPATGPEPEPTGKQTPTTTSRSGNQLQESLSRMVHEMQTTAGVERIMFAMLTPDRKGLRARYVTGAGEDAPLRRFQLELQPRNLFTLLMAKPQGVWLNADNREKYGPLIPQTLREILHPQSFFASSIYLDNKALGMVYADHSDPACLTSEGFLQFKRLVQRFSNELSPARMRRSA